MASPNPTRITRIEGSLIRNPTDLNLDYPYGGTPLGNIRDGEFRIGTRRFDVMAEEFGVAVSTIVTGEIATLAVILREVDNDWVQTTFLDGVTGAVTGRPNPVVDVKRDGVRAGTDLKALQCAILVAPARAIDPAVYMPVAIPMRDESAGINVTHGTEVGILTMFQAVPNNVGTLYQVGPLGDIVL